MPWAVGEATRRHLFEATEHRRLTVTARCGGRTVAGRCSVTEGRTAIAMTRRCFAGPRGARWACIAGPSGRRCLARPAGTERERLARTAASARLGRLAGTAASTGQGRFARTGGFAVTGWEAVAVTAGRCGVEAAARATVWTPAVGWNGRETAGVTQPPWAGTTAVPAAAGDVTGAVVAAARGVARATVTATAHHVTRATVTTAVHDVAGAVAAAARDVARVAVAASAAAPA